MVKSVFWLLPESVTRPFNFFLFGFKHCSMTINGWELMIHLAFLAGTGYHFFWPLSAFVTFSIWKLLGSGNFLKVMLWNSQCKGSKWVGSWKWSGSEICSKSFSGRIQLHLPFHLRARYRITWQDRIHLHIQHWCPPRSWSLVLPLGHHNFT